MISTISPSLNTYAAASARPTECPEPPAPPTPPAPPDQVDFGVIDTPAKAAAVPALDPAVQLSLAAGVAAVIMAGMGGGSVPLITLDIATKTGGQDGNLTFTLDAKDEKNPVSVSGDFAGQAVSGGLVFNEQTEEIGWNGTIGGNVEQIRFLGANEQEKTAQVAVTFGAVNGTLSLSPIMGEGGEEDFKGYRMSGDLGGAAYNVDTILDIPDNVKKGEPDEDGKFRIGINSNGTLGEAAITRSYKVEAQMTGGGVMVSVTGGGDVAGISQEINGTLAIVP